MKIETPITCGDFTDAPTSLRREYAMRVNFHDSLVRSLHGLRDAVAGGDAVATREAVLVATTVLSFMDDVSTIDLAHVAYNQIQQVYIETFGPLDPNIMSNDIDSHICDIIKAAAPDADEPEPPNPVIYLRDVPPGCDGSTDSRDVALEWKRRGSIVTPDPS